MCLKIPIYFKEIIYCYYQARLNDHLYNNIITCQNTIVWSYQGIICKEKLTV